MDEKQAFDLLNDKLWRLSNLYYIKNKSGNKVLFKPNWAQIQLLKPHYLNIILKARVCALFRKEGGTNLKTTTRRYNFLQYIISGRLFVKRERQRCDHCGHETKRKRNICRQSKVCVWQSSGCGQDNGSMSKR